MKKFFLMLICLPFLFSCNSGGESSSESIDNSGGESSFESIDNSGGESSSESIESCLVGYDWCSPNCSDPTMAWKFSGDGTFNYSTTMFGGMSAWGTWEDIGNKEIKIVYTRTSTGDVLPSKVISMPDCKSLKINQSIYRR